MAGGLNFTAVRARARMTAPMRGAGESFALTLGMRTPAILFALLGSHIALADPVQPRAEPASPETNDADFVQTKYEGPAVAPAELATVSEPSIRPPSATLYLPLVGTWVALDTLRPCNGTQLECRRDESVPMLRTHAPTENDGLLATSLPLPRSTETTLHLVPSLDGIGVWRRF